MDETAIAGLIKQVIQAQNGKGHITNIDYLIALTAIGMAVIIILLLKEVLKRGFYKLIGKNGVDKFTGKDRRNGNYVYSEQCHNAMKELNTSFGTSISEVHKRINSSDIKLGKVAEGIAYIKGKVEKL